MAIRRVLVANRGEIAVRIISTCRALGIETVLAASADRHRQAWPRRWPTGRSVSARPHATSSYLNVDTHRAGGARRALRCAASWIRLSFREPALGRGLRAARHYLPGTRPPTRSRRSATSCSARRLAERAGVAVAPGGSIADAAEAEAIAARDRLSLAGKGRGRRRRPRHEARRIRRPSLAPRSIWRWPKPRAAFGDSRALSGALRRLAGAISRCRSSATAKRVLHLGERDCSVQRRYQKVVEEAPAPGLERRSRGGDLRGGGAVLPRAELSQPRHRRIPVRSRARRVLFPGNERPHPGRTSRDRSRDRPRPRRRADRHRRGRQAPASGRATWPLRGHAIECRINAEAPARISGRAPGGSALAFFPNRHDIRVDTYLTSGADVAPFYDSMIAKIIAFGPDRASALASMRRALRATRIEGVDTNIAPASGAVERSGVHRGRRRYRSS